MFSLAQVLFPCFHWKTTKLFKLHESGGRKACHRVLQRTVVVFINIFVNVALLHMIPFRQSGTGRVINEPQTLKKISGWRAEDFSKHIQKTGAIVLHKFHLT